MSSPEVQAVNLWSSQWQRLCGFIAGMESVLLIFLTSSLLFSNAERLIDLSWAYDDNTIFWPGGVAFGFTREYAEYKQPKNFWYAANDFKTAEHCGTHLDAPYHFKHDGWKVADIPLDRFITTGILVNATLETNGDRNYKLPVEKLLEWEESNGPIPEHSVVLISFGWSSRYGNRDDYLGANGSLSFPGLSKEAAQWLVDTKKVVGVGVDTASVDQGENTDVHIILNGADLYNLENVAITEPLPPIFNITVLPMKIARGTGAPTRVVAVL